MHRTIQSGIGILEAIIACVLIVIGFQLPRPETVEERFGRVERVTRNAESQVRSMREQVAEVRHRDFPRVAAQLHARTRDFSAKWNDSPNSFPSVEVVNESVAVSALGLEDWSESLDVDQHAAAQGTPGTIDLNRRSVSLVRATHLARMALEQSASLIELDCRAACMELGQPLDAIVVIQAVGVVDRLAKGLDRMKHTGANEPLRDLRRSLLELETTLESAHRHVEAASFLSLPVFIPAGASQSTVQMVPLWPEGKKTAYNLRYTLNAIHVVNQRFDAFARFIQIPGRRLETTCDSSGIHAQSPKIMRDLGHSLHCLGNEMDRTLREWPQIVQAMRTSARLLRCSHEQIDGLVAQRREYERVFHRNPHVTQTPEDVVQTYSTHLDARLLEQEQSLGRLEQGLGETAEAVPAVSQLSVDLLNAIRWLFWLGGGLIALHGAFVICAARAEPFPG